jgi:endonuclease G
MDDDRRRESLNRLEGLLTAGKIESAKAAIDKSEGILAELGFTADQAREALTTPPHQLESTLNIPSSALEAIVRSTNRPPLVVRNNLVEEKTTLPAEFPVGTDVSISAVEHLLPSVGRIEFLNHDMSWGGTGWVIAIEDDDHLLVATNRHVAKLVARRTFRGEGVFMFGPANVPFGASIDFVEEADVASDPDRVLRIEAFTYLADDAAADIAIGRVKRPDAALGIFNLPLADNDGGDGEMVAVVGYPAADPFRNDPTDMARYFKGLYDVKRFSPGFLRVQGGASVLTHDCTTLGGNSGSPVISLESGEVVGLHFAGRYGVGNSAVRVSTLRAVLDRGAAGEVHASATVDTESRDGRHDADHFDARDGYDPDFLQVAPVPMPIIPASMSLAVPSDATAEKPNELRYQHFGILYSADLKSPVIAALNIDGSKTRAIKRSNSRWFKDLRIPAETQLSREEYGDPAIDRGHLVRRAATNWGDTDATALRSNLDSYHYTVASPQHMGLNRRHDQWLGLENYIMENTRTHGFRTTVFTGPIFSPQDPELGDTGSPIPLQYFKVVTMLAPMPEEDDILRLHSTAYVLSQGQLIQQLLMTQGDVEATEGFSFGAYRTFQVRIRDLEQMTGYDFGPLRAADPLEKQMSMAATEGPAPRSVVAIDSFERMVL